MVHNTGSVIAPAGVKLVDRLPVGLTLAGSESKEGPEGVTWGCEELEVSVVTCFFGEAIPPGGYAPGLAIIVSAPSESSVPLVNDVSVSGGGALVPATTSESTVVGVAPQSFGITEFSMEANTETGERERQAGGHPWQVTTSFGFPWEHAPANEEELQYAQVDNVKKITVELPAGLVGNLLTVGRCTQPELRLGTCPADSAVGTFAVAAGQFAAGDFEGSGASGISKVYNMVPEPNYPVVLGIAYVGQAVFLYVTVVHAPGGDRVRVTAVGVPPLLETGNVALTLWGDPGVFNEHETGEALLTNPVDCSAAPAKARLEVESWGDPGHSKSAETTVFPELTGCDALQSPFTPSLAVSPLSGVEGTTRADSPSGFSGSLVVPQTTGFEENATSLVRDASVTLPPGVSLSPAAAQGLVGCKAQGPEGINLGTTEIGPGGKDLGNPEATEFGAGHAGGNGSPYDDAQYHTAPGHCPPASTVGAIEVFTPLLETRCGGEGQQACEEGESPAPLQGHVYLAEPKCGGAGQSECTAQSAEDGTLFAGYAELSGDGVLIKERATISVDQATGRVTVHLHEAPEFPFSELKLKVHGGSRAPVATPQACGAAATTSAFTPWSSTEAFSPSPSVFTVDADGQGGACPATWPFAPGFVGGPTTPAAGAFSPFTATLTRQDREQNVTGLSVTLPQGLLAMLSSVTPCPEPQAASGACPEASLIGHDTAGVGSGSTPFYAKGRVYLTGPYKGAPFGLTVVTSAAAGPFNLGNVIVRAKINVDPTTAAVTITSDPLPQSRLGIPLRLKMLNVVGDRPGFIFNPTNCSQLSLSGMASGDRGASVPLQTPVEVGGCRNLHFGPVLKVSTPGKASKRDGAGLAVSFTAHPGQANVEKLKVALPKQLPSRLATLQKACTDSVFNTNPAGCPAGSVIGSAVLHTPVLKSAMTGPIYLVSHGGGAFPDLVVVLQAEGITVNLVGTTNIKKGITSETFRALPDAPFTSFKATFPQGPHSILATNLPAKAKFNLCGQKLNMPTSIVGQNNAVISRSTKITITGCGKRKHTKKSSNHKH